MDGIFQTTKQVCCVHPTGDGWMVMIGRHESSPCIRVPQIHTPQISPCQECALHGACSSVVGGIYFEILNESTEMLLISHWICQKFPAKIVRFLHPTRTILMIIDFSIAWKKSLDIDILLTVKR